MIRGAIFDVDGTLLDSMGIWKEAGARYLFLRRIPAEPDLDEILFPMSLEEGAAYLHSAYSLRESADEIRKGILEIVRDYYYREAPCKPGVPEFLESLCRKGIPLVIATSSDREQVEAAFRRLKLDRWFRRIFTCSETGEGKSSPRIYHQASEFLGTPPQETFVFEDALHAIRTAVQAGYRAVGVQDEQSAGDREEIIRLSDIYLPDMTDFTRFWEYASK